MCFQAHRLQILAEYDEKIKLELEDIKAAYEKKTQTEKSIRQKLEKEVEFCRLNHATQSKAGDAKKDLNADIKKLLEEKEAKILQLEKELIQVWPGKVYSKTSSRVHSEIKTILLLRP